MLLKETIAKLIQKNQQTKNFISTVFKSNSADDSIVAYPSSLEQFNYDSSLSLPLANLLQFGSDPKVVEEYDLVDIERLFDSIIELSSEWGNAY